MTVKQFFKSTAFKCIAVLLCVLLVSGVLLAIAWGFLEVTDDERFNRKISVVYGNEAVTATEQDISGKNTKVDDATIDKLWFINEKNEYLVQASSRGNGGNVTCWITVCMNDDATVKGIGKVILYDVEDKAEYVGYIGEEIYAKFATDYVDGKKFTYGDQSSDEFIKTNATSSLTAVCNDVNGAVEFVKAFAGGTEIVNPYADFQYTDFINLDKTRWTVSGEEISFNIVTKNNGPAEPFTISLKVNATGKISGYSIDVNGSTEGPKGDYADSMTTAKDLNGKSLDDIKGYLALDDDVKDDIINTNATRSNVLCYNAAAFALANYTACLTTPDKGGN